MARWVCGTVCAMKTSVIRLQHSLFSCRVRLRGARLRSRTLKKGVCVREGGEGRGEEGPAWGMVCWADTAVRHVLSSKRVIAGNQRKKGNENFYTNDTVTQSVNQKSEQCHKTGEKKNRQAVRSVERVKAQGMTSMAACSGEQKFGGGIARFLRRVGSSLSFYVSGCGDSGQHSPPCSLPLTRDASASPVRLLYERSRVRFSTYHRDN